MHARTQDVGRHGRLELAFPVVQSASSSHQAHSLYQDTTRRKSASCPKKGEHQRVTRRYDGRLVLLRLHTASLNSPGGMSGSQKAPRPVWRQGMPMPSTPRSYSFTPLSRGEAMSGQRLKLFLFFLFWFTLRLLPVVTPYLIRMSVKQVCKLLTASPRRLRRTDQLVLGRSYCWRFAH